MKFFQTIQFTILIFIIVNFSFCDNTFKETKETKETEEIVTQWMGATFLLPETSEILYKDSLYYNSEVINNNAKLKIVTLLRGECSSCVKDLSRWDKFYQFINSKKEVELMYYLYTQDVNLFRKYMYKSIIHQYPLIIDKKFKFVKMNELPRRNKQFQTFLLDSDNRVLLVGNPINNEKLMKLYKQEINKRLD